MSGSIVHLNKDISQQYIEYNYRDSALCFEDFFSIIFRAKYPVSPAGLGNKELHFGLIYNEGLSTQKYISVDFSQPINVGASGAVNINGTYTYDTALTKSLDDWKEIKIVKKHNQVNIYYEGQLIKTVSHNVSMSQDKLSRVSMLSTGTNAYLDWVKVLDSSDNVQYFEDFNDCQNFAKMSARFKCTSDCISLFTDYFNQQRHTNYNYQQVDSIYQSEQLIINVCTVNHETLRLCGKSAPVFGPATLIAADNCSDSTNFAFSLARELYSAYRDSLKNNFDSLYHAKCLQAYKLESFTVTHPVSEYHYTLYYYDQAGNLVKTVPPEGVKPNRSSIWLTNVAAKRAIGDTLTPAHTLVTTYRYNSLNQVIAQATPDAGKSGFYYDRLGRLALSQNSRQKADNKYSYTTYDPLGRITEVGELQNSSAMSTAASKVPAQLNAWLSNAGSTRMQITHTYYDASYVVPLAPYLTQRNLRGRVSWTALYDNATKADNVVQFNTATLYTYDIHGNVDTLLQDYGNSQYAANVMNSNNNRYKRTVYQYDLISGKVNSVAYQPPLNGVTQPDAFYHQYMYD